MHVLQVNHYDETSAVFRGEVVCSMWGSTEPFAPWLAKRFPATKLKLKSEHEKHVPKMLQVDDMMCKCNTLLHVSIGSVMS